MVEDKRIAQSHVGQSYAGKAIPDNSENTSDQRSVSMQNTFNAKAQCGETATKRVFIRNPRIQEVREVVEALLAS